MQLLDGRYVIILITFSNIKTLKANNYTAVKLEKQTYSEERIQIIQYLFDFQRPRRVASGGGGGGGIAPQFLFLPLRFISCPPTVFFLKSEHRPYS